MPMKREMRREKVAAMSFYDLDTSLDRAISQFQLLKDTWERKGYRDLSIDVNISDYEHDLIISGTRMENDQELQKRKEAIVKRKEEKRLEGINTESNRNPVFQ